MKKTNEIEQSYSFVFNQKEKSIYLKTFVKKSVPAQNTYSRTQVVGSQIDFEIVYKKQNSIGTAKDYTDIAMIKLGIPVPKKVKYTKEIIRSIIKEYLKNQSKDAKFHLKIVFLDPDGSAETVTIKGISEDADIDLTN